MLDLIEIILIGYLSWKIFECWFYHSKKFKSIKSTIQDYVTECNELNQHIEDLKSCHYGINMTDYGIAEYNDQSTWNFSRPEFKKRKYAPNIYRCSRVVCDNASKQPFKYVCKYFDIKATEEYLSYFESMLNNFEAVEQGKVLLQAKKDEIIKSIDKGIPSFVRTINEKKFSQRLGFNEIDLGTAYFPKYIFQYISSGGNSSLECTVTLDLENLNRFVQFLAERVHFRKSIVGQRQLMTSTLRKKILERDEYTCRYCGVSLADEPHLLLEVDHIVPISKGGLTQESNLQTLCWKCNRSKGSTLVHENTNN